MISSFSLGINLSCNNNKNQMNDDNRQSVSPTSDFIEDSNVSEDNASSMNSSDHVRKIIVEENLII